MISQYSQLLYQKTQLDCWDSLAFRRAVPLWLNLKVIISSSQHGTCYQLIERNTNQPLFCFFLTISATPTQKQEKHYTKHKWKLISEVSVPITNTVCFQKTKPSSSATTTGTCAVWDQTYHVNRDILLNFYFYKVVEMIATWLNKYHTESKQEVRKWKVKDNQISYCTRNSYRCVLISFNLIIDLQYTVSWKYLVSILQKRATMVSVH